MLARLLKEWERHFCADDPHSVCQQIYRLVWDSCTYHLINESRRYARTDDAGKLELSGFFHRFIDRSFVMSQVISIRRLIDKLDRKGPKGVVSLRNLICEIDRNVHLMTRRNMLEARGVPYEYIDEMRKQEADALKLAASLGKTTFWCNVDQSLLISKWVHEAMDVVCGTVPAKRIPTDEPMKDLFSGIVGQLDSITENICRYADKYVAHSATLKSLDECRAKDLSITLRSLWDAEEAICKIASFIGEYIIDGSSRTFSARHDYDILQNLDVPIASNDDTKTRLYNAWVERGKLIDSWCSWRPGLELVVPIGAA